MARFTFAPGCGGSDSVQRHAYGMEAGEFSRWKFRVEIEWLAPQMFRVAGLSDVVGLVSMTLPLCYLSLLTEGLMDRRQEYTENH